MVFRRTGIRLVSLAAVGIALVVAHGAALGQQKEVKLEDAIKARTGVTVAAEEAGALNADIRVLMRKVIAKAEGKQMEGNIYLTKDKYAEAVASYGAAGALYRQAVDGRKVLERLGEAVRKADRARMLAEGGAESPKIQEAKRVLTNAEGYVEAGEFEAAIAEYAKAQKGYEALLSPGAAVTLEEAVTARTSMLAVRKQVKGLSDLKPGERGPVAIPARLLPRRPGEEEALPGRGKPKPGSLTDQLRQATAAEASAAEALEGREYAPAKALFVRAEGLYKQVIALQAKRDKVLAVGKTAEDSMKLADGAFKTEGRPASFERGKQALADARKALDEDDLDVAEKGFAAAVEQFAKAQGEADVANELGKAQEAYAAAAAGADETLLAKHAQAEWTAAKAKAADAEAKAKSGDAKAATAAYQDATKAIKDAFALAKTKENAAKAVPIIDQLNAAKDKFAAEDILAQLESLIPSDPRMPGLRDKVQNIPGPAKALTLDLGSSQSLKLVVIRPGKFTMGSPDGEKERANDEGPQREVTITKPFYMGATEVTQAQYEALMGKNPSNFKGPQNPAENVSWNDAVEFCRKLSEKTGKKVRLPTEAEWEYACRAGTKTRFGFGDDDTDLRDYAWYQANSESKTHPVGQKKPNAWGLYDMHGNVCEWCSDYHADSYANAKNEDPQGPGSGSHRVLRGGSWLNLPQNCRSAYRGRDDPDYRHSNYGFRVVMDLK